MSNYSDNRSARRHRAAREKAMETIDTLTTRFTNPEINQTRGNAPLNARLAVMLSALTPGVTLNESPSDAQILAAVQAVVGEVLDLRAFRDNVRNLATDRPLALQCKQQFIEALSEDAPF